MPHAQLSRTRYDAVVVGGGHNGLVAAAYLASAGLSVAVLERRPTTGGAATSARTFAGVDARLSEYAYLVGLLPPLIVKELGLDIRLLRRRVASYTPCTDGRPTGLLLGPDGEAAAASMREVTGDPAAYDAWTALHAMTGRIARAVFPTLTEPLHTREEMRRLVGDDAAWEAVFERPLGQLLESRLDDDLVRGVVLTDGLIGTFASSHDPSLRQNRCFLYHVIGGGTGDWDVPVGGMGALSDALATRARALGAEILTGAEAVGVATDGTAAEVRYRRGDREDTVGAAYVLAGCAPRVLARLLGEDAPPPVAGAQLKVNMLLRRLPRLRDPRVRPEDAFAGTFHINETYGQLEAAYQQAARGQVPEVPPCEVYCHSLTDPSILGPAPREVGAHTLTLFGLHMPYALFGSANDRVRRQALDATLRSVEGVLAEPVEDCLYHASDGDPCVEAKTPVDLEEELAMPGGNIFHRPLAWPFAEHEDEVDTWGVETSYPNVSVCGAGARRGGAVSGVPGRAAAMAILAPRSLRRS
ncbi:MAG: phytoene desaturase family protein [Streptosporangiaceae bacterium]